jgi:predicted DNA-binding protein YlxM (UPF0122 family)
MILTDTEQAVYDAELYELALKSLDDVWTRNAEMILDYYEYDMTKAQLARENDLSKTRVHQVLAKTEAKMRFQLRKIGV